MIATEASPQLADRALQVTDTGTIYGESGNRLPFDILGRVPRSTYYTVTGTVDGEEVEAEIQLYDIDGVNYEEIPNPAVDFQVIKKFTAEDAGTTLEGRLPLVVAHNEEVLCMLAAFPFPEEATHEDVLGLQGALEQYKQQLI